MPQSPAPGLPAGGCTPDAEATARITTHLLAGLGASGDASPQRS